MSVYGLEPERIRDISPLVLDSRGRMRILPTSFWEETTPEERALFGNRHGIYGFPTVELVDYLTGVIAGRSAIEIGAGSGVLAEALGIPATDNRMQARARYRRIYEAMGQPVVRYGRNVIEVDANTAVRRFRPEVVIGCWVTHKWEPARAWAGGNEIGVDERDIVAHAEYVMIGNEHVHRHKAIWSLPHVWECHPFLFSRAANGTPDFVARWNIC